MSTSRSTRSGDRALRALLLLALLIGAASCGRRWSDRPLAEVSAEAGKGTPGAMRELVARFADPDPAVSQAAWDAAVKIAAPIVPELVRGVGGGDPTVGEYSAGALGSLRAKEGVDPLVAALGRAGFRRYVAAWALGEIGDPKAVPALVAALGDADPETRKFATRAVTKLGPAAVDALLAALDDPAAPRRRYAARALGQMQERRAVEPLLRRAGKIDSDVVVWALGHIGDNRALPLLERTAGDPDWRVRLAAIQALGDLSDPAAVPALTRALEDGEWICREWAARGLESVTGERFTYRDQHGTKVFPYSLYR
jgi:HEAT repeat protein